MNIVCTHKNRQTGHAISVVDNRDGSFESTTFGVDTAPEGGTWATVCEDHGFYALHETRALATAWAAQPIHWCQACQDEVYEGR